MSTAENLPDDVVMYAAEVWFCWPDEPEADMDRRGSGLYATPEEAFAAGRLIAADVEREEGPGVATDMSVYEAWMVDDDPAGTGWIDHGRKIDEVKR